MLRLTRHVVIVAPKVEIFIFKFTSHSGSFINTLLWKPMDDTFLCVNTIIPIDCSRSLSVSIAQYMLLCMLSPYKNPAISF